MELIIDDLVLRSDDDHKFSIYMNNVNVGKIVILNKISDARGVQITYEVNEEYRKQGIATKAVKVITEFILSNGTKVYAHVITDNIASIRVLEKSGFVKEDGTKQIFLDGKQHEYFTFIRQ